MKKIAAWMAIIYVLALATTQWVHVQGDLGTQIYESDRGGGGAENSAELRPRDPVTIQPGEGPVHLSFVIDGVDLASQSILGRVTAELDADTYKRDFGDAKPPSHIVLSITGLFATESVRVPLVVDSSPPTAAVPVRFEAWGHTNDYPSDDYGSNNFLSIGSFLGYPSVEVRSTANLMPYNVLVAGDHTYLNFLIERKAPQQWWVYTIALAPTVLIATLATARRRLGREGISLWLELGVGVLAILPLRQVLVPPDLPSLTRVDVIFGVQLVAFMGLAVIGVSRANDAIPTTGTP